MMAKLKAAARRLTTEVAALSLAARHPGTPWYAKVLVVAIVAYAVSPIDLIPDFIPVLGVLDDLLLLPLGIALAIRLIPAPVLAECRSCAAAKAAGSSSMGRIAAVIVVLFWIALAIGVVVIV